MLVDDRRRHVSVRKSGLRRAILQLGLMLGELIKARGLCGKGVVFGGLAPEAKLGHIGRADRQ